MTKRKSVSLPELPRGKEFEECVSAYFQCAGFFIERNIIERSLEEVLELDIITTQYEQDIPPEINLLEVKSGKWGFPDIFKIRGWMYYLNIIRGLLIVNESKNNDNFFKEKAKQLNIDFLVVSDIKNSNEGLKNYLKVNQIDEKDFTTWRFSYWLERNLLIILNNKKKSVNKRKCYRELEKYYYTLNSGIFFTENIIDRVRTLYNTFQQFPLISAKCGHEMVGDDFKSSYTSIPQEIYVQTYFECKFNDICISTFVEHRARLAILKSAIDYKIYKDLGENRKTEETTKILGIEISKLDLLPESFKDGLSEIATHKYFYKYPTFWQWFMWIFGGFILLDYVDKEYDLLSEKTGIPLDEIPKAFESYQLLFPRNDNWFIDLNPNSNIRVLRMFPVPFMGIGANYRRILYTSGSKYEELNLTGLHTLDDLYKWNNVVVDVLSKKLKY